MCGIVGVMGYIDHNAKRAFKDLLVMDSVRGPHSVGVMRVDGQGKWQYQKNTCLPQDFMDRKQFNTFMAKDHRVLLGHNRYATQGAVTNNNAHPFNDRHITGVHNGTLRNTYNLPDHNNYDVDSENLIHAIAELGPKEAFAKAEGAWAAVWHDDKENKMMFLRNKERPLWMTTEKGDHAIWWASESWMLHGALARNSIKHGEVVSLEENVMHSFKVPDGIAKRPLAMPTDEEVLGAVPAKLPAKKLLGGTGSKKHGGSSYYVDTGKAKVLLGQGDVVRFYVDKVEILANSKSGYRLEGALSICPDQEVFCFLDEKHVLFNNLQQVTQEFRGKISSLYSTSYNGKSTLSISIDPSTIKMTEPKKQKNVVGPFNQVVSLKKWYQMVEPGCSGCTSIPILAEALDLYWMDYSNFLCNDCATSNRDQQVTDNILEDKL